MTPRLPLRPGAYSIKLTVADEAGHLDTAALRLLRLPDSMFDFGKSEPDEWSREVIGVARRSLESAVAPRPPRTRQLVSAGERSESVASEAALGGWWHRVL